MTAKTARRFLSRNQRTITKINLGITRTDKDFVKQYRQALKVLSEK